MSFDAGSIETRMTLDRTAFNEGLRQAKIDALEFTKGKYSATLDLDTAASQAKLAALNAELDKYQSRQKSANTAARDGGAQFNLLFDSIAVLGPALVPLASGLLGVSTSLIGIGGVGLLAFKGIQAEVKANTAQGIQFKGVLGQLDTQLKSMEKSSASGVFPSLLNITKQLNTEGPQLNAFLTKLAPLVGDVFSKLTGAGIALLNDAMPTITAATKEVDNMVGSLERWAQGPAGAQFFSTIAADMPLALSTVGNLLSTTTKIIVAAEPVGKAVLDVLNSVLKLTDSLPVPVLTAIVAGLGAWRLAALATAAANKLVAVSATEAAAAGLAEGRAGALGQAGAVIGASGVSRTPTTIPQLLMARMGLGGVTAGGIGAGLLKGGVYGLIANLVGGTVANSTKIKDPGTVGGFAEDTAHLAGSIAQNLFSLHPWTVGSAIGSSVRQMRTAQQGTADQAQIAQYLKTLIGVPASVVAGLSGRETPYYQQNTASLASGITGVGAQRLSTQSPQALTDYATSLQKNIDAENKWLDSGGKMLKLQDGMTVSQKTYEAALKAAGGDVGIAVNNIEAHSKALQDDTRMQQFANDQAATASQFFSDLSSKYNITSTQANTLAAALGLTNQKLGDQWNNLDQTEAAFKKLNDQIQSGPQYIRDFINTVSQLDVADNSLTNKTKLMGAALLALSGGTLTAANTNLQGVSSLEALSTALDQNKKSVGANGQLLGQLVDVGGKWVVKAPQLTAGALAVGQAMDAARSGAINLATSIMQNGGTATEAAAAFNGMRAQVVSTAEQMGYTSTKAEGLAKQIFGIPKDATTIAQLIQKNDMTGAIQALTAMIGNLNRDFETVLNLGGNAYDRLGAIATWVTDLSGTHLQVGAGASTYGSMNLTGSTAAGTPYSGSGRKPGAATGMYVTQGTHGTADDVLIRVSKGEYVVNAAATAKHFGLIDAINKSTQGFANGGTPSLLIPPAASKSSATGSAVKPGVAASLLQALGLDTPALGAIVGQNASAIHTALMKIYTDINNIAKAKFVPGSMAQAINVDTQKMMYAANARAAVVAELAKTQADLATVNSNIASTTASVSASITGGFNIATSGNGMGAGIMGSLDQTIANAQKFATLRQQALGLGLNNDLLQQITSAGPQTAGANLQAIVQGGAGYVSQLNSKYATLTSIGNQIGAAQAQDIYGKQQAADIAAMAKEQAQISKYNKRENDLLEAIRADIGHAVTALKTAQRQGK